MATPRPVPKEPPLDSTQAPKTAPGAKPEKLTPTSAEAAAPPSVPGTACGAAPGASATPRSLASTPERKPTSSGSGFATSVCSVAS